MLRYLFILVLSVGLLSCKKENKEYKTQAAGPSIYNQSVKALTDVIVHDIFSPPVASRIYTYASIGGYEVARFADSSYVSLAGKIKHLDPIPSPTAGKEYCYPLAANLTFLKIGKNLIFSEDSINKQIQRVLHHFEEIGLPSDVMKNSIAYSDVVSEHIIKWSSTDNYKQTRSFPKYSLQEDPATWKPTPPGYMDGIEPSWRKIRTFVMDSAQQFKPAPPTPFNITDKNGLFYKEVMEVYESVKNASEEQNAIANFWDCNPYKLNVTGHIMHATKKITPGGHWINIVGLVCEKSKADFTKTAMTYAMVSTGLADAFISCWDEKYRSNLIRPETVINEFIDPEWLPLLQTPPFPEYTSGHSVASASAATILTSIFGDDFAFDDNTEVEFGLPVRSFTSFYHASDEAAISRLYGGIHYRPAIVNGVSQGKGVGALIVSKLKYKAI
jgi:hypothetical protein